MIETSNKVDEEKSTKEENIYLSRDPNASFPLVIAETFYKHNISSMIEAQETPNKNTIGNLKDDALFLFNDEIQSKNDEQI